MDEKLESWINRCLNNNTFESREKMVEFCVGYAKTLLEAGNVHTHYKPITQKNTKELLKIHNIEVEFPIDWEWFKNNILEIKL